MPRKYIRKTNRIVDENAVKLAITAHLKHKIPIREAARQYNLKRDTLMSRIKSVKKRKMEEKYLHTYDSGLSSDSEDNRKFQSKHTVNQVFTIQEEENLVKYLKKSSCLHYGLSYKQTRILAFEYASHIPNCKMPHSWTENKTAGFNVYTY